MRRGRIPQKNCRVSGGREWEGEEESGEEVETGVGGGEDYGVREEEGEEVGERGGRGRGERKV